MNIGASEEETEEILFNSWSSNTVASILVDGQKINEVFALIKQQLELLRKRQYKHGEYIENLKKIRNQSQAADNQISTSAVQSQTNESSKISPSVPTPSSIDNKNTPSLADIKRISLDVMSLLMPQIEPMQKEIDSVRSELSSLVDLVNDRSYIDEKIQTMESLFFKQLQEHEKLIGHLDIQLKQQESEKAALAIKLDTIDSEWQTRFDDFRSEMYERFEFFKDTQIQQEKDLTTKISELHDLLSVQTMKTKQLESKLSLVTQEQELLKKTVEVIPSTYFEPLERKVDELYKIKANITDMELKADIVMVEPKANQSHLLKVESLADELQRRLIAIISETSERLQALDAKLDRRSDRIVSWCLKQLRKEMKAAAAEEHAKEGTDIGKIRCLVCDHVSTQHRDQNIVYPLPGLTSALKSQLRQRSPSPERDNNPPSRQAVEGDRPTTAPHSRLVKMGGNPTVNYAETTDDPDYIADFKYRAPGDKDKARPLSASGNNLPAKLMLARDKNTQSAPMIQIISHHQPAGSDGANFAGKTTIPTALKDLEQKYTPMKVLNQSGSAKPVERAARPGSAPMKR